MARWLSATKQFGRMKRAQPRLVKKLGLGRGKGWEEPPMDSGPIIQSQWQMADSRAKRCELSPKDEPCKDGR